ncbi:MAG: methylmalonyl-CoA mutase family protein [Bacteroidia bacterium]|jgi:methylmalonyl-CoA mutase|nr:methylmalonyl-CoA mutase family protein [Bacteroidia bacterium]
MASSKLFDAFDPISTEKWMQTIIKDLKGKDYEQLLLHNTIDGVQIKPFYNHDDLQQVQEGALFSHTDWYTTIEIDGTNEEQGNKDALIGLANGADGLLLYVYHQVNLSLLLRQIDLSIIHVQFVVDGDVLLFNEALANYCSKHQISPMHVIINSDPVEFLVRTGSWHKSEEEDLKIFADFSNKQSSLVINGGIYHLAGAGAAYEIGCLLAHANVYLNHNHFNLPEHLCINIATGINYFIEIAKLRAIRKVFSRMFQVYNHPISLWIHTETSTRYHSALDINNNLLRNSTMAMAAITGGCNSLCIKPHLSVLNIEQTESLRLAINMHHLLKHESYLNKISDVAAGSYYLEKLTQDIAEKAWQYFTEIEKNGGFVAELLSGNIQQRINHFDAKEQHLFNEGKWVMIGANKFKNEKEKVESTSIVKSRRVENGIHLIPKRLSAGIETN